MDLITVGVLWNAEDNALVERGGGPQRLPAPPPGFPPHTKESKRPQPLPRCLADGGVIDAPLYNDTDSSASREETAVALRQSSSRPPPVAAMPLRSRATDGGP
ncbi:hypothetical protein AAFF_G00182950 [Aldrovandia affinis]|uniref:Uncharacterized protein n=1 Tax=Aldrovandia affinis TaxID=143900 RepID=A0AAD7W6Z0_9TELE|nr:hypothetical protein AAFF_G00182950 [Aldrovandia affinis]